MFSAHHPLASDCWQTQRQTQCSPRCAAKAGSVGGGLFLHGAIVVQQNGARISPTNDEDSSSMDVIHRQGQKRPEKPRSGFSIPETVFGDDKAEQAKATIARNGAHYGQGTGAVGHGAAVMPTLSKKAQTILKATPFSEPIAPSKSLAYRAKKS